MTAAPQGPDLSFLNEEEARAIFEVLQRDSELRRAEQDRVSKLLKRRKSETGLQGVTGEWFQEMQRQKFHNYVDVNRMLKPPLEHQLRKSRNTVSHYKPACHSLSKMPIKLDLPGIKDHKELKMSSRTNPQAQKNTSASFLGFRSPFAWLFSFRKSRKNQTQKQPRCDSSASPSLKVEEMATAEMCSSPVATETDSHTFDANQNEMMEKSTQEWSEQLEKEFFNVLSDLDDQLAQEQAQDPLDRTVSTSSASNVQYGSVSPTRKRQTASRGQCRNDWSDMPSTFFPDGLRTIRAKDEHKIFIRPRRLHSAYLNWHQTAFQDDYRYSDPVDGNPHLLSSRLPSVSFGRSSEGSLYPPSITHNSGFRYKSCMNRDTAGRSYSVCSLRRCLSSVSSDQLSGSSLHPLARETKNGFVPRFGRQNPKRIPLSSIVWNNTPDSPEQTPTQEKMFRTQSLMEFHATDPGRYSSTLQETKKYGCYHTKHHYRRSISSSNCFSRVSCPDKATSPLPFDNWENYPFYKSENNLSRSYYRDASSHGMLCANQKNSPYGKRDCYPSWADIPQYYSDEAFLSPDASFEAMMANLNEQQWAHTKNAKFGSQHFQNDFHMYSPENLNIKRITRSASRTFSEFTEGCQPWLSRNSSVSSCSTTTDESVFPNLKDQTKPIGLNRNSADITQRSTKADFTQLEKVEGMKLPHENMPLQSVSQQVDTNYINNQSFPSNSPASATLQSDASLFNTMRSKRQTQVTARGDTEKICMSNCDKRNVQMKGNDCPPNSVFRQPAYILTANESRKEPFLPSQKDWEHNLHYPAERESIKQDNRSTEDINQATPKRRCSLLNVASALATEKSAKCQDMLSCSPECSSSSSQSSPHALSHKDNSKCLGTLTSSSVNGTVTESQAEGGKPAQVSRICVTEKIAQKTLQNTGTLVTKDCNGQFTSSSLQNGNSGNTYMHSFDGDAKTSDHSLSYFCIEKESGKLRSNSPCTESFHKKDSLLRHTSSCSITGSPRRNSLKSPDPLVIYYTLPRKSASIAGSMSDTPISLPRESRTTYNYLRSEIPRRADAFCFNQRDVPCLDSKHSFSTSASLNAATSSKEKDYPSPLTKSPNDSVSSNMSVELTDKCKHLSRRESSVFSDCKDRGNFLQKYKTTSTFTVCVDEDHVKYHELVSIYYTLPRRHSKTFCNLFRDNPEDADLPCPKENAHSPRIQNKKNEGHVSLANIFSLSSAGKEVPSYASDQVSSALVTPQNLGTVVDSEEGNSHLSPSSEKMCTLKSMSTVHNRKDSSADTSLAENDMVTQSTAIVAKSGKAISDASSSQNTEICLKEKKGILQAATPLMSTLSTPPKPGKHLENRLYSTSTNKNVIQKGNSENCSQAPKVNTNKNLTSLLLHSGKKSSLGRSSNTERADVPLPPAENKYREGTEVKQRVNFRHQASPLYNNKHSGLQSRADSSRKNANDLNSCRKVLSGSQGKASEVSTAPSADPSLQLDKVVSTDMEVKNSKIKKEQSSQGVRMGKDYSGLQESERHREGSLSMTCKDKVLRVTQDQKITQSAEEENKLLSDCTRDKVKDIEKRKNRPSIKNKLAAVYKTSRKFSSKNLPPKPHISNIFSQNDGSATSFKADTSLDSLIPADSHQPFLQSNNKNQNHSLDSDENMPKARIAEKKKTEIQNDPSLRVNNANWRSFTSSYTQKEAISPKKTTVKVENRPSLATLFPDKAVTTRNKNSQTLDLRLESKSQPISPSATTSNALDDDKKRASSHACSPTLPLLTDKNSNTYVNSCLQADTYPEQNLTSQTVLGQCQNTSQPASLKNANLHSSQLHKSHAKSQRERHLSESICALDSHETFASGSNILPKEGIHGKRFKSYSELLSCDENENWASDDEKCYSTRNLMYPSVEFGIFGKEQQLAFLENIKRSLTEGRLWRPCLLNNPGAFRDGETPSINRAELLSSSSAGSKMSSVASSPREPTDIYQEDPAAYSDSDSDTTTDDEYYLDEVDKESEL